MTPDEHRVRAEKYLATAEEAWEEALDARSGEDPRWPEVHQEVRTLAALAQAHAALALHPEPPEPELTYVDPEIARGECVPLNERLDMGGD